MSEQVYDLKVIPIEDLVDPTAILRMVDTASEKYLGILDSVRKDGFFNPIAVRPVVRPDGDTKTTQLYSVIDGFHRYTIAKELGLPNIPCNVRSIDESELLAAQIMANIHKVETRPVEYSRALLQILHNEVMLTKAELAARLCKSPSWIDDRLGLLKLTDEVAKMVDDEEIGLSNAYALARLPTEEQPDYVDRAMTQQPQMFQPVVNKRLKELRDARLKGRKAKSSEFEPIPLVRTKSELVNEMETATLAHALCQKAGATDYMTGFAVAITWALKLDEVSANIQREADKERKAARDAAKESGDLDRKRKQAADAAKKAEKLRNELEKAEIEETRIEAAVASAV